MEENENQKKKKLPTFSIIFFGILAVINVYLFWYHPTGICIFWGIFDHSAKMIPPVALK